MAEFKSFSTGVELQGDLILAVVEAMGPFKKRGYEILEKHGLKDVKPEKWYSHKDWLSALKDIYEVIGPATLKLIGANLSQRINPPPTLKDFVEIFESMDTIYHMRHRKDGKQMYDPVSGKMTEGIGHYYVRKTGERSLEVVCQNPNPCVFDLGSAEALVQRFKPAGVFHVKIVHDGTKPCRRKGGESCTHLITW